jgi:dTDP-4-amino-4,6-dideoxygalactose transaminase
MKSSETAPPLRAQSTLKPSSSEVADVPTQPRLVQEKRRPEDFAALGGPCAFAEKLHVGRPNIGDRAVLRRRMDEMLDRRWLSNNGPLVQQFEQAIATYVGVRHCICVCNATVGLEIAVRAADVSGEAIVPAYTFVATAHALQWQQITPVFADMDPATHNLDPARIERHITPRTTAIVATHVWGRPCAVESLTEIARRRGLKLIFDAAHALGCSDRGQMVGGFGLAEVFSFHATKFINSFEGGAITTNDDELAQRIRLMTNFGFAGFDRVIHLGTNGKMNEACAAMGLTSLESINEIIGVNRRNYEAYQAGLAGLPGLTLLQQDKTERRNLQYVVVEMDESIAGLSRSDLIRLLHAENVIARKYFWPGVHRMEPYRTLFPAAVELLPDTERVAARVIVLPTGTAVDPEVVARICGLIRSAFQHAPELGRRLAQLPSI